jgi:hypothetical protein
MRMVQVNENMLWHDFCKYTCDKNEIELIHVVELLLVMLIHCHDTNVNAIMYGSSNVRC